MALASITVGGTKPNSNPVCTPRFRYNRYEYWDLTDSTGGSTLFLPLPLRPLPRPKPIARTDERLPH